MRKYFVCLLLLVHSIFAWSQQKTPAQYKLDKEKRLQEKSPFEKIIDREQYATIVYENEHVIAFSNIKDQAPVHYLIVPKKRIATVNDITEKDVVALGHLFLAAKELAQGFGIAESGFRLVVNTNQDAGQSVFHLHMHLLGGHNVGAMATTEYSITKPALTLLPAIVDAYVGRYQFPSEAAKANAFVLTVVKEGDKLYAQLPGQPKSEVFAQTNTRFFSRAVNSEVEFIKNADGEVNEVIFYQGGQQLKGKRMK
jgi:histidine triad (HIT) family protein